ncbi:hypothetical protein N7540_004129 [Penicillium herquei]|nr:hypothetical protein N7540_004129 [Penicillium herquei]
MRVLYYTFICLFGTTLAMPVQSQGAQALSGRQTTADAIGHGTDGLGLGLGGKITDLVQTEESSLQNTNSQAAGGAAGADASGNGSGLIGDVANAANNLVSEL